MASDHICALPKAVRGLVWQNRRFLFSVFRKDTAAGSSYHNRGTRYTLKGSPPTLWSRLPLSTFCSLMANRHAFRPDAVVFTGFLCGSHDSMRCFSDVTPLPDKKPPENSNCATLPGLEITPRNMFRKSAISLSSENNSCYFSSQVILCAPVIPLGASDLWPDPHGGPETRHPQVHLRYMRVLVLRTTTSQCIHCPVAMYVHS